MTIQTQVKINSVDVTDYVINYVNERVYGDAISQIEIRLVKTVNNAVTLQTGQTVEMWRGFTTPTDTKYFSGYVESFDPDGGTYKVVAKDKLWDLVRKEVTKTYQYDTDASAGKISEIFKDLVTTYGGLSADATTIQDSGSVVILQKFVCNHADIFERCKQLARAINWQFYYRADTDKVYFEPQGFTTNSNTLTVGSNIIGIPKWSYDNTEMVNDLTITGASQSLDTTETGRIGTTSGYTTTSVSLTLTPVSVRVYADTVNPPTTLKEGGVPDSSADFYYYVDKPQKKIYPKASTTFTTNDYFKIDYSYEVPIPINTYNQLSIDAYGRFTKTIHFDDIRTVADAESRAIDYLERYSRPFIYSTVKVKIDSAHGLDVGQSIRVVDSLSPKHIDQNLIITRLRLRYPSDYDEIDVGDKVWRSAEWQSSVEERLKRLIEDQNENTDIIYQIITADNTLTNYSQQLPVYQKVLTQSISDANALIWGHPTQGTWNSFNWSSNPFGAETNHFVMQYLNTYTDSFLDTDFKNATDTNATWTAGSGEITFTAGQKAYSSSIDYSNGTITTATATFTGSGVGTPTYYLSANGGTNWETVTSGSAHTFSNTGTDLRWRVDVAGGAYTLTEVSISGYH